MKLYAPSAARSASGGEDGGSVAVRRCKEAGWEELPAKVCDSARLLHAVSKLEILSHSVSTYTLTGFGWYLLMNHTVLAFEGGFIE